MGGMARSWARACKEAAIYACELKNRPPPRYPARMGIEETYPRAHRYPPDALAPPRTLPNRRPTLALSCTCPWAWG